MDIFTKLKNELGGVEENISLAKYTTLKIGGSARYFYVAKKEDDIINAVKIAKENNIPYFILGNGSNLLVSDKGFNGLVIKIENHNIWVSGAKIHCGAGEKMAIFAYEAQKSGLSGAEWMVLIPGTIGGAICGNAGAFGMDISKIFNKARVLNSDGKVFNLFNNDCRFGYRDSVFKYQNLIILSAEFELKKYNPVAVKEKMREYAKIKVRNQLVGEYSAGYIFKNIYIEDTDFHKLLKKFPELSGFLDKKSIPAGYLIDECGLKGFKIGGAIISQKHANHILNFGGAKAEDVIMLISIIKQKVRNKFGILLEEEIKYFGF